MDDFDTWFGKAQKIAHKLEQMDLYLHEAKFYQLYEDGYTPRQAVEGFIEGFL